MAPLAARAKDIFLDAVEMALGAARRKRQHRIELIQRLNGGLFIDTKHGGMLRRAQVQPDNVSGLDFEIRIVAGHVALKRCGFRPASFHTRCTASFLMPSAAASLRQLQCVEPSFGFLRVAERIRARSFGVSTEADCPG